jgi:ankyrin repeat protein
MGLFGFGKKPIPNPYTREDMQRDINPSRINSDVYQGNYYTAKPLECAISSGDASIVGELIRNGADIHFKQSNGYLAIVGMLGRNLSVLKEVIKHGFDVNTSGQNGTLLHCLAQNDNPNLDVIRFLIKSGADVNSRGSQNEGRTPVQYAAVGNNTNVLQLLIDAGAEINIDYYIGETPLFEAILGTSAGVALAFGGGNPKVENVRVLVNAGAKISNRIWNLANKIGNEEVIKILKESRAS